MVNSEFRLAMIGMIPGNGHPYSWSALLNGYDRAAMAACPYPAIPKYLGAHPDNPIDGARVTHIWTDEPEEASRVAAAARIETISSFPEDVIGKVDGVIIATDDGDDHMRRARPFVEAGLPVFVDKPLATNRLDLQQFNKWVRDGARILSSSGMRYSPELDTLRGDWRWITAFTPKTWERYGIHLLEPVACLLGPGFETVRLVSSQRGSVAHLTHKCGTVVSLAAMEEAHGGAFTFHVYGENSCRAATFSDTYSAFRRQLQSVVKWMRDGIEPFPFAETIELMSVIIAGIESRSSNGKPVSVKAQNPAFASQKWN